MHASELWTPSERKRQVKRNIDGDESDDVDVHSTIKIWENIARR